MALQLGDHRISEVAREAGFPDKSAFGMRFRQHTGMTPFACQRRLVRPGLAPAIGSL